MALAAPRPILLHNIAKTFDTKPCVAAYRAERSPQFRQQEKQAAKMVFHLRNIDKQTKPIEDEQPPVADVT